MQGKLRKYTVVIVHPAGVCASRQVRASTVGNALANALQDKNDDWVCVAMFDGWQAPSAFLDSWVDRKHAGTVARLGFRWVECDGHAHSAEVGGMQDHCAVCVPNWGRVEVPERFKTLAEYRAAMRKGE